MDEKDKLLTELHKQWVDAGLANADPKVYSVTPLINAILAGNTLNESQRDKLKEYPTLIKVLDYYAAKDPKPSKVHFDVQPTATVETLCQAILDIEEELLNGVLIEGIIDDHHPQIKIFADLDLQKLEQYKAACKIWVDWKQKEENRRWRNAYIKAGKPIPEEHGLPTKDDHIEIEPPEYILFE